MGREDAAQVHGIPTMLEYVMVNPRMHAKANPATGKIESKLDVNNVDQTVYPVSDMLQRRIEAMVRAAHKALGCRGYSLFDIRVDAVSGQPFIIECCAFWSFSPISILTLMLESSGVDYERVILDICREHALSASAARERKCLPPKAHAGVSVVVSK